MEAAQRAGQRHHGLGVGADVAHVADEAEQHHDRHAGAGEAGLEQGLDDQQLVVERVAGGLDVRGGVVDAPGSCGDHEQQHADGEDGGGRVDLLGNEIADGDDGENGKENIKHAAIMQREATPRRVNAQGVANISAKPE